MATSRLSRRLLDKSALAFLVITGCTTAAGDDAALGTLGDDDAVRVSSKQQVEVDVRADEPIHLGKNTVHVTFPQAALAELASVSALMPAHGHGSPAPLIEHENGGFVIRDLVLYMSGRWELRLGMRVDAQPDEAIVAVDVP